MIACVAKTAQNADFYQIIDFLTGCSINYSLLVDPDLIGPWLQQFWATASLKVINDVPHIRAKVAGKKILISEATIRADLLFDDENGVDPQWKYLVHVLLHCLSPKSTSWEQFGTNIASALVGLATNQKFNFSLMILTGMLGHISNGTPFLMYPRITPLTPSMLEVVTALAAEEEPSTSPHSRAASSARDAQGSPTQSAAHSQRTASVQGTASFHSTANSQGTAEIQGTDDFQGTAEPHDAASIPKSPNDYTPTDASQTSGGDEGLLDVVAPLVKHHAFWVENQNLKKQKRRRKKHKKKVSSVKLGRNKDEGTLSEEHYVQEEDTADPFFEDIADKDAAVTPDLERKSDETEEVNIEEKEASNVRSGDTEELDLETTQSTARQGTITPRTLNFEDEAGLSIPGPIQTQPQQPTQGTDPKDKGKGILVEEPKKKKLTLQQIRALETTNDEEVARKIQAEWDAEEERKRFEELKKTKPKTTLRKPTSLAQERNQMMSFLKGQGYKLQNLVSKMKGIVWTKFKASIKDSFKDFIPMDSEKEREMLKEREAKRLLRKRKATISKEQPSKKPKLRTETIDELRNYLRVVDFEKSVHDKESLEGISMITELQVIDSPDGEYLIIHRENNHFRAFDTLWEIMMGALDRQDLYHLYRVVDDYYEHIPPTGLGLMLLGDLNIIWETAESSDDDFWKDQEEWEIIRWRFHESSGVHTLEIEDGTMIHMLAERRYPLSRELMIRMLEHGMEVEDESETAITF
ncbi:hypothetical protein Tco_0410419 [Tanacetum coccineum]